MNEFQQRYAKLSREQRLKVRNDLIAETINAFPMSLKGNHTDAQVRSLARKKVDIALAMARRLT